MTVGKGFSIPLALLIAVAFAFRSLWLIDATALWSDELYSVGKSFQPSLGELWSMLRQDTHPPLYYTLLWGWGNLVGQSPVSLRLLSWLAYLAGGVVMVAQSVALADGRRQVVPLAVLLAFCSPYPIRFAIEGKSYALLVFLVALAWWWRRAQRPALYGITAALAGLTHFYGLFLMLAAAIWDGLQSRRRLALAGLMAGLPALAWIGYAADYLFSSRSGSWIGSPDFALLEETLARGLGLWPLPKLAVLVLLIWGLRRWGGMAALRWPERDMLDLSGLIPSGLMVVAVVLVSFIKPLAFSRYFVVLLPALVPVIASLSSRVSFNRSGRRVALAALLLLILSWWGPGFAELNPGAGGVREQDQFRLISQRTSGLAERYSPRARLLNLSDQMELAMGRISADQVPWGDRAELNLRLSTPPLPQHLWLASSGPPPALNRKLRPLQQLVEDRGFTCRDRSTDLSHARLLQCRFDAKALP